VRPESAGDRVLTRLSIDGRWVGVNRNRTYFFVVLDPGEHHLCSEASDRSVGSLTVEAGKSYYLTQTVDVGMMMKTKHTLQVVGEQEGREALAKSQLSVWKQIK